ncbi:Sc15 protein [Ceratobasidium sp. AG-Ba]|nr:Sc15 protein [Ceratobasidium sp. AG-Ba]QRW07034.1 Sc15 protein [Ceratobasidium sp. AG-Ba]
MRFAFFTTLFAYATVGLLQLVAASPILDTKDMIRRDNSDIMAVMTNLNQTVGGILKQMDDLVDSKQVNIATITPLVTQLNAALLGGASDLSKLSPASLRRRQSDDQIAQITADIVSSMANTLGAVDSAAGLPILGGLLPGIDTSLNQVLLGLSILLQGVLRLVANLLSNVARLLRNLALGLSLGTLGL